MTAAKKKPIHFHSSDDRFCGSTTQLRCFTFDPNEVTCRSCQGKDTFVLSPSGLALIAEFDRMQAAKAKA